MNKIFTSAGISARIWFLTSVLLALLLAFIISTSSHGDGFFIFIVTLIVSLLASLPALIALFIIVPFARSAAANWRRRLSLLFWLLLPIACIYGFLAGATHFDLFDRTGVPKNPFIIFSLSSGALFLCSAGAVLLSLRNIISFFSDHEVIPQTWKEIFALLFSKTNTSIDMEQPSMQAPAPAHSNRLLVKGLITGGLILLMWIPTIFIQNLVTEREARQNEIVKEVSGRWASAQTVSGPFLTVPYSEQINSSDGKPMFLKKQLIVTADKLKMTGSVLPEERPRSIYKVLLYRSVLNFSGSFQPQWPADINLANVDLAHAKLCFSISDFKGIEEDVAVTLNSQKLLLNPGLPLHDFGENVLSAPVYLSSGSLSTGISFSMQVRLKGSEQLHFIPSSANSKYSLSSTWRNPSFDGSDLPLARSVKDSGFAAEWNFNRANVFFGSVMREGTFKPGNTAFGVSLLQPSDQYSKTMRSVKYAILLIGLTFALFFIIEIMQKKPLHPVQYVLVGLALVIFYSLLLSISEFILFDYAYLIAAAATALLITLYAKAHFHSWRSAGIFGASLSALYGFVFILIRLEDTALLVGSIGLFVILALVMYASRRVRWYGVEIED